MDFALLLHPLSEGFGELIIVREQIMLRSDAHLIVNVEGRYQNHKQRIFRANQPSGIKKLLIWQFLENRDRALRRRAKSKASRYVHVQQIEQVVESKSACCTTWAN